MKLTLKQRVAKISVMAMAVTGLVGVGVVVDSTIGAEAAEASTRYNCRVVDAGYGWSIGGSGYRYGTYCYIDYAWEEEFWPAFQRDGWYFVKLHHTRCSPVEPVCA